MISLIDTHSHLDTSAFDSDRDAVLAAALKAGVHAIVLIGYDPERWRSTSDLCQRYPFLVRAVGVHPNSASIWSPSVQQLLEREVASGTVIAIGETGLDFFREHADPALQLAAFRAQLALAKTCGLPIIIHQRAAEAEVLATLAEFAPLRGVMHCFSGDTLFANQCRGFGLHLGIGGVATYPKSIAVREAVAHVPISSLLLETDAPYLAPQSRRGKRNEPAFLIETLETVAEVRDEPQESVADATTENAEQLFGPTLAAARAAGMDSALCRW